MAAYVLVDAGSLDYADGRWRRSSAPHGGGPVYVLSEAVSADVDEMACSSEKVRPRRRDRRSG